MEQETSKILVNRELTNCVGRQGLPSTLPAGRQGALRINPSVPDGSSGRASRPSLLLKQKIPTSSNIGINLTLLAHKDSLRLRSG